MATYTQNLDLKKPAQSDKIRIADINNNMDTIDGAVGDIGERSIAAQIGDVEGALAIVSTGNVHDAITSGQYVYIKNHDTLDDGLYVATANISANGTLSSSNVTADSAGGGLNALNSKMVNFSTSSADFGSNAWDSQSAVELAYDSVSNGCMKMVFASCKNGIRCLYIVARDDASYGNILILPCSGANSKRARLSGGTWTIVTITET